MQTNSIFNSIVNQLHRQVMYINCSFLRLHPQNNRNCTSEVHSQVKDIYQIIHIATSFICVLVNAYQIWCIKHDFKRQVNPLVVFIKRMAWTDLCLGVTLIAGGVCEMLHENIATQNKMLLELAAFLLHHFSPCLGAMAGALLTGFTIARAVIVVRNRFTTRKSLAHICSMISVCSVIMMIIKFILVKMGVVGAPGAGRYASPDWCILGYIYAIIQIASFVIIIAKKRESERRVRLQTRRSHASIGYIKFSQTDKNIAKLAALQVMSFLVCGFPHSILIIIKVAHSRRIKISPKMMAALHVTGILCQWWSIFNAVMYFFVYKPRFGTKSRNQQTIPMRRKTRNEAAVLQ